MEAKRIIIAAGLFILIVVFSFVPFNNQRKIVISAPLFDVAKQINDLNNWKKWNPDLADNSIKVSGSYNTDQTATLGNGQYYLLHHINPLNVFVTRNLSNASTSSIITITPSNNDSSTLVNWVENVNIFKIIERSFTKINSRLNNLNNLKKLLEDVNYKYGFFIKIIPVKDTLILTAKALLLNNTSTHVETDLYKLLQSFIKKNKLPAEQKYFYKTDLSDNKIAVGIPVYKKLSNEKNIEFLELPSNGRLVEAIYSGNIANKQSAYAAINNFMLDQHLKQVAQPFEQYNIADTNLNVNSNINIKIFYPVF